MNQKLKAALRNSSDEQGFALPLAIGMGMVMIAVGMTMVIRSQGDQITASTQRETSRGQGAAETGITRYQSFLNQRRVIATYPHQGSPGWSTAENIPRLSTSCNQDINTIANSIKTAAATAWKNVDANDANRGQYRLVSYTYQIQGLPNQQPNTPPGIGTLTVEGRVNQGNADRTATTRLAVNIPVTAVPIGETSFVGLWSTSFTFNANAVANSNVLDSSCGTNPFPANRIGNLPNPPYPANTRGTIESRRVPFPLLPNNNVFAAPNGPTVNNIPAQTVNLNNNSTLPRNNLLGALIDVFNGSTYTYNVGCDGNNNSISVSGNGSMTLGRTGEETIILYLNCDLRVADNGRFRIFRNAVGRSTRVIIYANRNIQVSENGFTNPGPPESLMIYKYGAGQVSISANGTASAFVFAPQANATVSGNGDIRGAIWSNTMTVTANGSISQLITEPLRLEIERNLRSTSQSINSIGSWQRQEAQ